MLTNVENEQLQEVLLFSAQQEGHDQEVEVLRKELAAEKAKNKFLSKKLELLELINRVKTKLNDNDKELLDELLEAQEEYIRTNSQFAKKQIGKNKQKLLNNSNIEQEINQICQLKEEITKSENEQQLEARILVPEGRN